MQLRDRLRLFLRRNSSLHRGIRRSLDQRVEVVSRVHAHLKQDLVLYVLEDQVDYLLDLRKQNLNRLVQLRIFARKELVDGDVHLVVRLLAVIFQVRTIEPERAGTGHAA